MKYEPITDAKKKQQFIEWLKNMAKDLNGKKETPPDFNLFPNSEDGDIVTVKDLTGNFLATLSGESVTID